MQRLSGVAVSSLAAAGPSALATLEHAAAAELSRPLGLRLHRHTAAPMLHVSAASVPAVARQFFAGFGALVLEPGSGRVQCCVGLPLDVEGGLARMVGKSAVCVHDAPEGTLCTLYFAGATTGWAVATLCTGDGAESVAGPPHFVSQVRRFAAAPVPPDCAAMPGAQCVRGAASPRGNGGLCFLGAVEGCQVLAACRV